MTCLHNHFSNNLLAVLQTVPLTEEIISLTPPKNTPEDATSLLKEIGLPYRNKIKIAEFLTKKPYNFFSLFQVINRSSAFYLNMAETWELIAYLCSPIKKDLIQTLLNSNKLSREQALFGLGTLKYCLSLADFWPVAKKILDKCFSEELAKMLLENTLEEENISEAEFSQIRQDFIALGKKNLQAKSFIFSQIARIDLEKEYVCKSAAEFKEIYHTDLVGAKQFLAGALLNQNVFPQEVATIWQKENFTNIYDSSYSILLRLKKDDPQFAQNYDRVLLFYERCPSARLGEKFVNLNLKNFLRNHARGKNSKDPEQKNNLEAFLCLNSANPAWISSIPYELVSDEVVKQWQQELPQKSENLLRPIMMAALAEAYLEKKHVVAAYEMLYQLGGDMSTHNSTENMIAIIDNLSPIAQNVYFSYLQDTLAYFVNSTVLSPKEKTKTRTFSTVTPGMFYLLFKQKPDDFWSLLDLFLEQKDYDHEQRRVFRQLMEQGAFSDPILKQKIQKKLIGCNFSQSNYAKIQELAEIFGSVFKFTQLGEENEEKEREVLTIIGQNPLFTSNYPQEFLFQVLGHVGGKKTLQLISDTFQQFFPNDFPLFNGEATQPLAEAMISAFVQIKNRKRKQESIT